MSYFENLTPAHALESLGLRRDEVRVSDVLMPVLVAFGVGLGIGAGAALLFAPQTGRELRGDLRASAGRIERNVRKALPTSLHMGPDQENKDYEETENGTLKGRTNVS